MTALVTIETILLVLLSVLVAALLRSHAEILRRLAAGEAAPPEGAGLPPARATATAAFDVAGASLEGDPVALAVATARADTLLAFLSSGCTGCGPFWNDLRAGRLPALPGDARLVVVTKDSSHERPSRLRDLAPPSRVPVVMSTAAWEDYRVEGSPYFILVDGPGGRVRGEGTASNWDQVVSLLRDAADDSAAAVPLEIPLRAAGGDSSPERLRRADRELRAAGIVPGHPSLYGEESRDA